MVKLHFIVQINLVMEGGYFTFTLPENIKAKKISSVEIDIISKEKDEIVLKNADFK